MAEKKVDPEVARIKPLGRKIPPSVRAKMEIEKSEKYLKGGISRDGKEKYVKAIAENNTKEGNPLTADDIKRLEKVIGGAATAGKYAVNIAAGVYKTSVGSLDVDSQNNMAKCIKTLALYSPNITKYSTISKGGSQFKTIRIPKTLINLPKPKGLRSNVLVLVQMSNAIWNGMFKGLRPLGIFTKAMLAWFRDQSPNPIPIGSSLSNNDVMGIIDNLGKTHPNILNYYVYYKAAKSTYNKAVASLKEEATRVRQKYEDVIRMGVASPERIQALVGGVIGAYDAVTDMPKASNADLKEHVTDKLSTGDRRRVAPKNYRYLISTTEKEYEYGKTPVVTGLGTVEEMKKAIALPRITEEEREAIWPKGEGRRLTRAQAKKKEAARAMELGAGAAEAQKEAEEELEREGEYDYEYEPEE